MLTNKTIVLGITGGIAAYKAADLASKLVQAGAKVEVVMTEAATRFITPLTLRNITHRPVITDMFEPAPEHSLEHIALAEAADVVVIAPATANTIAKLAWCFADNILTCLVLATKAPVSRPVSRFANSSLRIRVPIIAPVRQESYRPRPGPMPGSLAPSRRR